MALLEKAAENAVEQLIGARKSPVPKSKKAEKAKSATATRKKSASVGVDVAASAAVETPARPDASKARDVALEYAISVIQDEKADASRRDEFASLLLRVEGGKAKGAAATVAQPSAVAEPEGKKEQRSREASEAATGVWDTPDEPPFRMIRGGKTGQG